MIRRNFVDLNDSERQKLANALNHVNSTGLIAAHATTHEEFFLKGIHWRPQFLPWHRYFLRRLELAMQEYDSDVSLPYWDWTQANSQDLELSPWKEVFGGRENTGGQFDQGWNYIRNNSDSGWSLPTMDHILTELSSPTYQSLRKLEGSNNGTIGSHVHAHVWVGETMGDGDSPNDPLFYLHHCNLDRIWAIWQLNNPTASQYNASVAIDSDSRAPGAPVIAIDEKMPEAKDPWENGNGFSGATPEQMVDHTNLGYFSPRSGYSYARDPILEAAWQAKFDTTLITHVPQFVG